MRKTARSSNGKLKINVVAGTFVVMIGIGLKKVDAKKSSDFAIHRIDHDRGDEGKWLEGMKVFEQSAASAGELVSTREFPIQGFYGKTSPLARGSSTRTALWRSKANRGAGRACRP